MFSGRSFVCDSNSIAEKPEKNDDNKKLLPPLTPMPPLENVGGYCVIKERMTQAFRYFKELTELNVLAQVWAPVPNGNQYVLTTSGQPFVLDLYLFLKALLSGSQKSPLVSVWVLLSGLAFVVLMMVVV
ncbi:hypothetical protein LR48_Vigan02g031100 [Vigna angularis]|uniref:Uncharacterized protein n=1 Tax=Phaseolus angularis TaxID=3914 RepID=A0A0L9TUI1_PHAAN|nr:hypothetical protein LR48_Vigan02g031100 [Vigna angularis]